MKINALEQEQQNTIINNYMVNPLSNKKFYFIGDLFCNKTLTRNTKNWMEYLKDFLELSDEQVLMKYENNVSFYKEYLPSTSANGNLPYQIADEDIYSPLDLMNQLKASNPDFTPTDIFICIGALDLWATEMYFGGWGLEEETYKSIEEMINKGIDDVLNAENFSNCNIWIGWIPVMNYHDKNDDKNDFFYPASFCQKYLDKCLNSENKRLHYLDGVELCLLYKYEDTYNPQSMTWNDVQELSAAQIDNRSLYGLPTEEGNKMLGIGIKEAFLNGKFSFSYVLKEGNSSSWRVTSDTQLIIFSGSAAITFGKDYISLIGDEYETSEDMNTNITMTQNAIQGLRPFEYDAFEIDLRDVFDNWKYDDTHIYNGFAYQFYNVIGIFFGHDRVIPIFYNAINPEIDVGFIVKLKKKDSEDRLILKGRGVISIDKIGIWNNRPFDSNPYADDISQSFFMNQYEIDAWGVYTYSLAFNPVVVYSCEGTIDESAQYNVESLATTGWREELSYYPPISTERLD